VFYEAKLATAGLHTERTKKPKDYGINTEAGLPPLKGAQGDDPSFIPFPFGFLSAFAGENAHKNHSYAKANYIPPQASPSLLRLLCRYSFRFVSHISVVCFAFRAVHACMWFTGFS
jgi:hypothetical protein